MLVLVTFGVVAMGISLATNTEARTVAQVYASLYGLVWGVTGSLALGAALGVILQAWSRRASESGEVMILGIGMVLVAVGGARMLHLSPLFATLAMGATMVNASPRSDDFRESLGKADPPLYAAFFVLAGAELQPGVIWTLGAVGIAYIVARATGKMAGAWVAARQVGLPPTIRRYLGLCLLSSSSLAIGLTIQVRDQFPEFSATVTGIVLAGVLVFEVVGPLATQSALVRAGETTIRPRNPFAA